MSDGALVFAGTHRQIGEAHGETLKGPIRDCLAVYRQLWGVDDATLERAATRFGVAIESQFPHLSEEIRGIAAGCGLQEYEILGINSRTELLTDLSISECTAVGVGRHVKVGRDTVLAQNWDWMLAFRGLTRVVEVRAPDRPAIKMLIEPGMVGKIGLNAAGLGVCLNYLPTATLQPDGLPVHVLLRAILECSSTEAAVELVTRVPRAACANYLIGDAESVIVSLETRPDHVSRLRGDDYVAHTNSFNSDGEFCARQAKFEQALQLFRRSHVGGQLTPEALRESFTVPGVEFPPTTSLGGVETIHTIVLNLTRRRLLVSDGARSSAFAVHTVN
jgi:isopenicillin-N N-acyltransferase-like protein